MEKININEILNSYEYNSLLNKLATSFNLKIFSDNYVLHLHTCDFIKSDITIQEVKDVLSYENDEIESFCRIKKSRLDNEKNNPGEFSKEEELDKEDYPELIEVLGICETSLLFDIIYYIYIKNHKHLLLEYLKKRRIPYAKKFQQMLIKTYQEVNNDKRKY